MRYNIRNSSVAVVGCVEPFFLAKITTYEYSRTVKTKTMSAALFATLTAEEKRLKKYKRKNCFLLICCLLNLQLYIMNIITVCID